MKKIKKVYRNSLDYKLVLNKNYKKLGDVTNEM